MQKKASDLETHQSETLRTPTCQPRLRKPVHLKQFSTPHVSTPKRARSFLHFSKSIVDKKDKKIHLLQQTIRRMKQKITTLSKLTEHLRNENYITDSLAENITVHM